MDPRKTYTQNGGEIKMKIGITNHARQRSVERFGFDLTEQVVAKIKLNEKKKLIENKDGTGVFSVYLDEFARRVICCYCPNQKVLVTIYDNDWASNIQDKNQVIKQKVRDNEYSMFNLKDNRRNRKLKHLCKSKYERKWQQEQNWE